MWNRRSAPGLVLLLFPLLSACSDSPSPTTPTPAPSGTPPVQVNFSLTNAERLSTSLPALCAVDRDATTCPSGLQPQVGTSMWTGERTDTYTLKPGTYLLTGRVNGNAPTASVSVRVAFYGGGVDKTWGGSIMLGTSASGGAGAVPRSVVEAACVKTFSSDDGEVEWGVIFRVVEDAAKAEQLCQ